MDENIQAIYEGGVLRPLVPLPLRELEQVQVTIHSSTDDWQDSDALELARAEGDPTIPMTLVRKQLSQIAGSLAEAVIDERGEY